MENKLPKNWIETNISNLIGHNGIFSDGDWVESKDQDINGDVRLIQLADIGENLFRDKSNRFLTSEKAEELHCTLIKQNDVLIARMPDPIGRSCVFPLTGKYATVVDVAIVRLNNKHFIPILFSYLINSPEIRHRINNLVSGSTRLRISRKNLDTIPIPLPPLPEQERIVAKLDTLFAQHERMKQALARIPQLLKDFRQQILTQAVTGKLTAEWRKGKDLEEWKEETVGNIATDLSGFAFKSSEFSKDGHQLIRMGNLYGNKLELDRNPVFIPDNFDKKIIEKYSLKKGDILLTLTGTKYKRDYGYAIQIKEVKSTLLLNQRILCLRNKEKIVSNFLLLLLRGDEFRDNFFSFETGGVNQGNVGVKNVTSIIVSIPPLPEQEEIVQRVESLFAKADAIEARYQTLKEKIDALPQTILHKAFKGELVPQLPTDGDAKDLLAEILKLKKETGKQK